MRAESKKCICVKYLSLIIFCRWWRLSKSINHKNMYLERYQRIYTFYGLPIICKNTNKLFLSIQYLIKRVYTTRYYILQPVCMWNMKQITDLAQSKPSVKTVIKQIYKYIIWHFKYRFKFLVRPIILLCSIGTVPYVYSVQWNPSKADIIGAKI